MSVDPATAVRPRRKIHGMSAILLPFTALAFPADRRIDRAMRFAP